MKRARNKVVIITGGASGIGRVSALRFAAEGAKVVIWDIDKARAEATISEIEAAGLTPALSLALNYSWFDFKLDYSDLKNDGNKDGKVQKEVDLPINTPNHKGSLALNYSGQKFFGSVFTRYVQAYDFYSGINVAAAANPTLGVQENARYGRTWNYGPLGGFTTVDISAGYHLNSYLTASAQVVNLFDTTMREFVASPFIGRLYSAELKVMLPALGAK